VRERIAAVDAFGSVREAKDDLAGKNLGAARAGEPGVLGDRAQRLEFSETGWTWPGMAEISAKFDRTSNQDHDEQRMAGLMRNIKADNDALDRAGPIREARRGEARRGRGH
jgi:hypothetical protein